MYIAMQQVLLLLLFVALGYVLCKAGKANSSHAKLISVLQVYVFLPCTVINTYSANFTIPYIREKYPLLLVSIAILAILLLVGDVLSKMLAEKGYLRTVYRYSLTLSNYGGFGYPLVGSMFGDLMLQNAMIFALPLSIYTNTHGYAILTKTPFTLKKIFSPVVIASIVGAVIGLTGIQLPYVLDSFVDKSAACMAPVCMLLVGMVISEFDVVSLLKGKKNYIVAVLRLLILPCVIAGGVKLLGFEDIVIPALMMYAMPCGMNTVVFPRLVDEDCQTGAALTLITSVLACVTIPICVAIFT